MFLIPVPFSKYHKEMLAHCKELLEYRNGCIFINPIFNTLITSLRTAVEDGLGIRSWTIINRKGSVNTFVTLECTEAIDDYIKLRKKEYRRRYR